MTWTGGSWDPGIINVETGGEWDISPTSSVSLNGWTANNDGNINWTQGDVENTDSTINNNSDGTFNISSSGTWADAAGDGLSSINGGGTTVVAAGNGNSTIIETAIDSTGTLQIDTGTLILAQAMNAPAPIEIRLGAATVGNNGDAAGFTSGAGSLITVANLTLQQGGTLDGAGNYSVANLTMQGGIISGAGNMTVGILTMREGTLEGAGNVVVNGQFNWSGGSMDGSGATTLGADCVSSFSAQPGAPLQLSQRSVVNGGNLSIATGTLAMGNNIF